MSETEKINPTPRISSRKSVDKALDLIKNKSLKINRKRTYNSNVFDKEKRSSNQCLINFTSNHKKINASSAFSHTYAITEMRNAFMNEDWSSIHEMFPLLLKCLHAQPVIWRYAFLMQLTSPSSDVRYLQHFFEMCIGKKMVNNEFFLEKLMSLQPNILSDIT